MECHRPRNVIKCNCPETHDRGARSGGVRATQDRCDAGGELTRTEGLGDIVVGAEQQPVDFVDLAVQRGQQDDRGGRAFADAAAYVESVDPRQHDVEHYEVGLVARKCPEGGDAIVHYLDCVAVTAQVTLHDFRHHLLVFDHEDAPRCRRNPVVRVVHRAEYEAAAIVSRKPLERTLP
jgi:hypothetical protein